MAAQPFPEHFGAFKFYGPIEGTPHDGWTLSWSGEWLPGSYADKEALFLIIGLFLGSSKMADVDLLMRLLEKDVNQARPSRNITAEDIIRTYSP